MSYGRPDDDREFGGGGRDRDNYYNPGNSFNDYPDPRRGGGRRDDAQYEGGRDDYGDQRGGYGGRQDQGGYGGRDEFASGRQGGEGYGGQGYGLGEGRRHQRRDDDYSGAQQEGGYGGVGGFGERRHERREDDYNQGGGYGGRRDDDRYGGSEGYGQPERRQHHVGGGEGFGYGGQGHNLPSFNDEFGQAAQYATNNRPEESDMFSSAMSLLSGNKQNIQGDDFDEDRMQRSHQQLYQSGGSGQQHDANSLGAGAAMQAMKLYSGGGAMSSGGNQSQSALMGAAMSEASKLFDQQSRQGNVAGGIDKQSVITSAGKMALQMYMKQQMGVGGAGGAAAAGGGPGGLMSMASKFLS